MIVCSPLEWHASPLPVTLSAFCLIGWRDWTNSKNSPSISSSEEPTFLLLFSGWNTGSVNTKTNKYIIFTVHCSSYLNNLFQENLIMWQNTFNWLLCLVNAGVHNSFYAGWSITHIEYKNGKRSQKPYAHKYCISHQILRIQLKPSWHTADGTEMWIDQSGFRGEEKLYLWRQCMLTGKALRSCTFSY